MTMSYRDKLDDMALAFMELFPYLNQSLSLDAFLSDHQDDISEEELDAGYKLLCLFDE
jgi:hypothetical protein